MAKVKRKLNKTVATVIDADGRTLGTIEKDGKIGAARMANVARREFESPLVTIRDLHVDFEIYSMDESTFFEHATKE